MVPAASQPTARLAAFFLLASACSGGGPEPARPIASASAAPTPSAVATAPAAPKVTPCDPDKRPPKTTLAQEERTKGVTALAQSKPADAMKSFEKVMDQNPSDIVAFTLHIAATADMAEERQRAGRTFGRLKPLKVEGAVPPHKLLVKADKAPATTFKKTAEEKNNGDFYSWLMQMGLDNRAVLGDGGEMPSMFGPAFGDMPMYASQFTEDYGLVRYGPGLLVLGEETQGMRAVQLEFLLVDVFKDQTKLAQPETVFPEARYVTVVGSTLLAELAHDGDGQNVKGDGVVVAIDLLEDKIRWISDWKVGNSYSVYTTGTHYVTAFTEQAGPGKINVLDIATGDLVASEAVPFRVDYIVGKGNKVYVWGYEKTLTFELSSAPALPPAKLGRLVKDDSVGGAKLDPGQQCWLANAALALDHRDGKGVLAAIEHLPEDTSATRALQAAGDFLIARASGTPGIDLTEKQAVAAQYVADAFTRKDGPKSTTAPKRLTKAKDPIANPPKPPYPPPPTPLYSNMRLDVFPMRYGMWNIEGGFPKGEDVILIYGRRFVVTLRGSVVQSIVDLKPLLGPEADKTPTPLYFVTVLDGVLYGVVTPGGGYGPGSEKSYVVAMDPTSGKVLWRSASGVFPRPFQVFGDLMLFAKSDGKTGELVAVRYADGQVVSSMPFKDPIIEFSWDSRGLIYVQTKAGREYYALK